MKYAGVLGLMWCLFSAGYCHAESNAVPHVSVSPSVSDNFSEAGIYLKIPEGVDNPRLILVLLPGLNGDGKFLLESEQWVGFAREHHAVILACTFKMKSDGPHYAAAHKGSGAALEKAIIELQSQAGTIPFKDLPMLMYGHSAGGQFAYGFSCHHPERLIGFAATKGGYYFPQPKDGTYSVPGLMISGQKDAPRRKTAIKKLFQTHRAKGAPWCWLEDDAGHGRAKTMDAILPYFSGLIADKATKKTTPSADGIWVHVVDHTVHGASPDIINNPDYGWMPNDKAFQAWKRLDIGRKKLEPMK